MYFCVSSLSSTDMSGATVRSSSRLYATAEPVLVTEAVTACIQHREEKRSHRTEQVRQKEGQRMAQTARWSQRQGLDEIRNRMAGKGETQAAP